MMEQSRNGYEDFGDAEMIRSAVGDPAAFEALFRRHAMLLRQWLLAQTHDVTVAEDLVAETFAQAWRGVRRFRGEDEQAGGAWLYGIARHLLQKYYRANAVETAGRRRLGMSTFSDSDGGIEDVPARLDASALSDAVIEAFAALGPDQRRAVGYRVIEGLSFDDAALRMGCAPATARTRVFRGLAALRAAIAGGGRP